MPDHVHMLINVPPKLAVSSVVGYIKGQECDSCGEALFEERAKLRRAADLGPGVFSLIRLAGIPKPSAST